MTKIRKEQTEVCYDCKDAGGSWTDGKKFNLPDPHPSPREIDGDEPYTQTEDHKPAIINPHRDAENAGDSNPALIESENAVHARISLRSRKLWLRCQSVDVVRCELPGEATRARHTTETVHEL